MSNALQVKAKIALQRAPHVKGTIVEILKSGKYKVLLDRDWHTGRTMVYSVQELTSVN